MKKSLSLLLTLCMMLSFFSGAVFFGSSAATYETIELNGFSTWTQAEMDKSSGNNGYANGCCTYLTVVTDSEYRVGDTKQAIKAVFGNSGTAYNNCIVNWTYGAGGPSTAGNVWAPADGSSVNYSDYDGIRVAVLNANGEPANFNRITFRVTEGWNYSNNMRYWDSAIVRDDEGYFYFDFASFTSSGNPAGTDIFSYLQNAAKGISMLCYGGADENTCYYSSVQLYKKVGAANKQRLIKGVNSLESCAPDLYAAEIAAAKLVISNDTATQEQVDAQVAIIEKCIEEFKASLEDMYIYTQLEGVQNWTAEDASSMNGFGSKYSLSDKGLFGNATQSIKLTATSGNTRFCFATQRGDGSFIEKNPYKLTDASAGKLSDYEGIAVAFCDENGDPLELSKVTARLMRDGTDWGSYWNFEASYTNLIATNINGYYHISFADYPNLKKDDLDKLAIASLLFYTNVESGDEAYISDMLAYRTPTENDLIDPETFEKVRGALDNLLNTASDLGFFDDESSPEFAIVSEADRILGDPECTFSQLREQLANVRLIVAKATMDADTYAVFAKAINTWEYNYTKRSYDALTNALNDAWDIYESDPQGAVTILNDAYAALVSVSVRENTANFFEGWTTEDVNATVDANAVKSDGSNNIVDSIGEGLNINNVYNAGDFSANTIFEANDNFSMTALADFTGKSMGWKNMDRSQLLCGVKDGAYPAMNVAGLSLSDGIRFKLEVTGGSVERLLIGLSNCSTMVREMYALKIKPEYVDADGYINIPFSYFRKAFWCEAFKQAELENVIVFIVEAYGVTADTTITISELTGYVTLGEASDEVKAKVADITAKLEAFDIDGRYAELIAKAKALGDDDYDLDYEDVYDEIFAVLKEYGDPDSAIVDVPGFSVYSQQELDQFSDMDGGSEWIKTDRGMIYRMNKGGYAFANGVYVSGTGFEDNHKRDPHYGELTPIGGKTFVDMLGGYKFADIFAFRFKVDNATKGSYMGFNYKDGVGLWGGMLTNRHDAYPDENNYFTYYVDDIPVGAQGDWYGEAANTKENIFNNTKFVVCEFFLQNTKEIYGWQVILYKAVDRAPLKEALATYAGLGVDGYDDAMKVYYDAKATEADIAAAAAQLAAAAIPKAPAAPKAAEITQTSVTLVAGAKNIEYRLGENGEWTTGVEFTGLTPNTEYKFYARVAANGVLPASEASKPLTVTTLKTALVGEAIIEGTTLYGETLSAVALNSNAYEFIVDWYRDGKLVAEDAGFRYTLTKEDIGCSISVVMRSDSFSGELVSEASSVVGKATPVVEVFPEAVTLFIGEALGSAEITGAVVNTEGTWAWVTPELIPTLDQSGSGFTAIFTPADADCYDALSVQVEVIIDSNTEKYGIYDEETGITVYGEYVSGKNVDVVFDKLNPGTTAYLALLRVARNSGDNTLILFRNASLTVDNAYVGTLEFIAELGADRAGAEYTVWYFADGEVRSSVGTVDSEGILTVSGVTL